MIVVGILVGVVMIVVSAGQLGDPQHVTGTSLTGGQAAQLAIYCAVTGMFLLVRRARR